MSGDVPTMVKVHIVDDTGHEYQRAEINLVELEQRLRAVDGAGRFENELAHALSSIGSTTSDLVWLALSEALRKRGLK